MYSDSAMSFTAVNLERFYFRAAISHFHICNQFFFLHLSSKRFTCCHNIQRSKYFLLNITDISEHHFLSKKASKIKSNKVKECLGSPSLRQLFKNCWALQMQLNVNAFIEAHILSISHQRYVPDPML